MRHSPRQSDRPILITEAPINADDEYNQRRKKYLIMMIIRALCIIGAASTFTYAGWLAAVFVAAAVVLPWSAVLIANNRPPKQALRFRRFLPGNLGDRELTAGSASSSGRAGPSDRLDADRVGRGGEGRDWEGRGGEGRGGEGRGGEGRDWEGRDWEGRDGRDRHGRESAGQPDSQADQPAHRIIDI